MKIKHLPTWRLQVQFHFYGIKLFISRRICKLHKKRFRK